MLNTLYLDALISQDIFLKFECVHFTNIRLRHDYMPVGPQLRLGATLHYKTRIKTWSNISFLLSLSHNSYYTNWTAQPYTYELLEES